MKPAEPDQPAPPLISPRTAERLICWCLFLMAPVFALTTWQGADYSFTNSRHFSVPVLIFEVVVVATGILGGARPIASIRQLPRLSQIAFASWLIVVLLATSQSIFPLVGAIHLCILLLHLLLGIAVCDLLRRTRYQISDQFLLATSFGILTYLLIVLPTTA